MPRDLIKVSVGQAGNQIGHRFWELAVREHAAYNTEGLFDDSMSSFFRNVDNRQGVALDLPATAPGRGKRTGGGGGSGQPLPIAELRARAVLVDMEEGEVKSILKGPLGELFDSRQLLTDVSGSGNNWAHGYGQYGPQYRDSISEVVRGQPEACDSLQGFMLLHSLGGGTGSGLGSYILQQLEEEYPEVQRFTTSVFPSTDDDVVTSPYNALLSLARLAEHADCVLPVDNAALQGICCGPEGRARLLRPGIGAVGAGKAGKPFDAMNSLVAQMLLNLTASVRFEGQLNLDLNEVTTNLVPYPRLHFLLSSLSPLAAPRDVGGLAPGVGRGMDQAFLDVFQAGHQLAKVQPNQYTYLACGLVMRGGVVTADLSRNLGRIKQQVRMARWNEDGFTTSICSRPPVGLPFSLLCLANNCGIGATFAAMQQRFQQLYPRRLYTHHYQQYIEVAEFDAALEAAAWLTDSYQQLNDALPPDLARLRPQDASSFGQNSLRRAQLAAAAGAAGWRGR